MAGLRLGAIIVLTVLLVVIARADSREGFASRAATQVAEQAGAVFSRAGPDVPYREYRARVAGADPVQFHRVRALARNGALTPEAVQAVL